MLCDTSAAYDDSECCDMTSVSLRINELERGLGRITTECELELGESVLLRRAYNVGRLCARRACIAAISSSEKPISARDADHVGGSPTNLLTNALAELTFG